MFTFIGEIKCADCDEGTLIAELLEIMLVGLIRTAEFVGLVYGISSSFSCEIHQFQFELTSSGEARMYFRSGFSKKTEKIKRMERSKKIPLIFNYNFSSVCSAVVISSVGGRMFDEFMAAIGRWIVRFMSIKASATVNEEDERKIYSR